MSARSVYVRSLFSQAEIENNGEEWTLGNIHTGLVEDFADLIRVYIDEKDNPPKDNEAKKLFSIRKEDEFADIMWSSFVLADKTGLSIKGLATSMTPGHLEEDLDRERVLFQLMIDIGDAGKLIQVAEGSRGPGSTKVRLPETLSNILGCVSEIARREEDLDLFSGFQRKMNRLQDKKVNELKKLRSK